MSQNLLRPAYRSNPIGSVAALSKALRIEETELTALSEKASTLYRLANPIVKADGSVRRPFDALQPLKGVHARIKKTIFSNVYFPPYLTGSLPGSDYSKNAKRHVVKKILVCEDIQNFFPSVSDTAVYNVWLRCLQFPPPVAQVLTRLTTKDGALPQGAITSSYLANLILYEWEPTFCARLDALGVSYSRYVDDIAMSASEPLSEEALNAVVSGLYGMLAKVGLRPKRSKHEIFTASKQMMTTKLVVNARVSLTARQRSDIRSAVFQVEQLAAGNAPAAVVLKALATATGRVGLMGRFHKNEALKLADRLKAVRSAQMSKGFATGPDIQIIDSDPDDVPW